MVNKKRIALNEVVRQIGSGMAFATGDMVSASIKDAWDELYNIYNRNTGLNIKEEADNRGYTSALDFVERVGCLNKLCELAVKTYERELTVLIGKNKTSAFVAELIK